MKQTYEISIEGRVQGVGYRYFVRSKAHELNLTGYARNCWEGKVIVVVEGEKEDLDTFVDYLRIGPPLAKVRNLRISESPFSASYDGFVIKH